MTSPEIEDYLSEDRTFPPSDEFKEQSLVAGTFLYDEADQDFEGFWARQAADLLDWDQRVGHDPRVGAALREVVRRRHAQRHQELPRPPRRGGPGRQGRVPLGGRAGRHPHDHLRRPAGRGAALRQRAEGPRRRAGRPGRHLHADDPRAADGPAGLRPDRRRPLGRVRRVLGRLAVRPHQRRRGEGAHHRRRRLAPGPGRAAQADRRRRARPTPRRSPAWSSCSAPGRRATTPRSR